MDRSTFLTGKSGVSEEEIKRRYTKIIPVFIMVLVLAVIMLIFSIFENSTLTLIVSIVAILAVTMVFLPYFFIGKKT